MKKYKPSTHLWFWIVAILLLTVGVTSLIGLFTPEKEEVNKPVDLFLCENDEDCTSTTVQDIGCGSVCPYPISIEGASYVEFLHAINCKVKPTDPPKVRRSMDAAWTKHRFREALLGSG